jgi:hypothetical protein
MFEIWQELIEHSHGPTIQPRLSCELDEQPKSDATHTTFAPEPRSNHSGNHPLYIPGSREREDGVYKSSWL